MRTEAGPTALCYASSYLDLPMVKSLLEHGANPNGRLENGPHSKPLDMAVDADLCQFGLDHVRLSAVVETLLENGADPSIPDAYGSFAEHKTSDPELKELLRGRSGVVSSEDTDGASKASEEHHR